MNIPNGLPILARGSHPRDSGKACIMNAISYLNGDKHITDMPNCVDPMLASAAQVVNDRICHNHPGFPSHEMCPECSHKMWLLGARMIGTGANGTGYTSVRQTKRMRVAMAFVAANPAASGALFGLDDSPQMIVSEVMNRVTTEYSIVSLGERLLKAAHDLVDIYDNVMGRIGGGRDWTEEDYRSVAELAKVPVYVS
jgi:hypothetical protein